MAKPLRQPQPSSSVARLLDLDAAARAVAKAPPREEQEIAATHFQETAHTESFSSLRNDTPRIKRELVLTRSADDTLTRLVEIYRRGTGTRLTTSHVARAMLKGVVHCFDQLERHAKRIGPLKLPCNARGRELERERFEARIADAFVEGVRSASAMDEQGTD